MLFAAGHPRGPLRAVGIEFTGVEPPEHPAAIAKTATMNTTRAEITLFIRAPL
jgi:hypothetical protein